MIARPTATSAAATVTMTLAAVNDEPVFAVAPSVNATDTVASDTFTASTGTLSATDVDAGTTLTYGIANVTVTNGVATKVGTYGTLAVTATSGAYTFTPNAAAINALSANTTETFTVTVSDGTATTAGSYTVNLTGVNDTPSLSAVSTLTGATEDTAFTITYAALAAAATRRSCFSRVRSSAMAGPTWARPCCEKLSMASPLVSSRRLALRPSASY